MNEMQAHGLLIPVGSKPFEVWIDKNNSLAELQDLVNGNVEVLRVDLCGPVHRLQRVYSH